MSRLFIIRHGQASFLSDNYDQLSENGCSQAKFLGENLSSQDIVFDAVYCGNLVRQVDTAEIVKSVYDKKHINFPITRREDFINEINLLVNKKNTKNLNYLKLNYAIKVNLLLRRIFKDYV